MNIQESINRGFNLLGTSIVGLAGLAFSPEIFLEQDWDDKRDDLGLFVIGVAAIVWYVVGGNRYKKSIAPIVFVALALVTKIFALIIEFHDKEAAGDDFGAVILFVLATGLIVYQYFKTKKIREQQTV